jgi:hypothetical protein
MRRGAIHGVLVGFCALLWIASIAHSEGEDSTGTAHVKLIYSSDLYWPPDDPDDYFDLATLYSIPEIEVLGIILDQQVYGKRPASEGTGAVPLRQIFTIAGRAAAFEIGLRAPLKSIDDRCLDQDTASQGGVAMVLKCLAESRDPVVLLTVGTVRDIAAAFNRDPALFREKVARVYINAGIYGFPEGRMDVNLEHDRYAFLAMMKSGLPVYWAPCFGENNFETFWQVGQRTLLETAPSTLQNYFLSAFSRGSGHLPPPANQGAADPIAFLQRPVSREDMERVYAMNRNMWSTVTFLDAAGLKIFRNVQGEYAASRRPYGDFTQEVSPYSFTATRLSIDDQGRVQAGNPGNIEVYILQKNNAALYQKALEGVLRARFTGFKGANK